MALIKFSDVDVEDIIDDLQEFSVFQSTMTGSANENMHELTLKLSDGRTIRLSSIKLGDYSSPYGFEKTGRMFVDIIRLVTDNKTKDMTIADFVNWIIDNYVTGAIKIVYNVNNHQYNALVSPHIDLPMANFDYWRQITEIHYAPAVKIKIDDDVDRDYPVFSVNDDDTFEYFYDINDFLQEKK